MIDNGRLTKACNAVENADVLLVVGMALSSHTWASTLRYYEGDKIYGLFNFSEYDKTAWINERDGIYKDLITGQEMKAAGVNVPAYGFFWLKKIN